jgi:hypothetical protein
MLGWIILFALLSSGGVVGTLAVNPASLFLKTVSFLFAVLFLLSLLTTAVRSRAKG